jgi:hypothetical protein
MVFMLCIFYSLVQKKSFIIGMPTNSVQHGVEPLWPWVLAKNGDACLMKNMSCIIKIKLMEVSDNNSPISYRGVMGS